MTVTSTQRDAAALTLTFVAEFQASVERVWAVWQDPRKLERWWGPPSWPATFERHDFVVGGQSSYYMTGPEGQKSRGWWTVTAIEAPHRLEFDDGFSDDNGVPLDTDKPIHGAVTIEATEAGARMTVVTKYLDTEQMEKLLGMGMEEGMRQALGQIDEVLADTSH